VEPPKKELIRSASRGAHEEKTMAMQENHVDLKNSTRQPIPGARLIGPADPNERVQVTITLRRGSQPAAFAAAQQMVAKPVRERRHLTRAEFAAAHGMQIADLEKIRTFATQHRLQVVSESRGRRTVIVSGTVKDLSEAFGVELKTYELEGKRYRGREGTLRIPADLIGVIEGVFGLDNRPQAVPHFRRRKTPAGGMNPHAVGISYFPGDVATAYNFPANTDGTGQAIAILELGGGYTKSDLDSYFNAIGLATPNVTAIPVDGGANSPGDPSGADGEVELDIEVAGAVAPKAQIGVYFAPNTDAGFLDALTTAVHDSNLKPSIVSISWGGPETQWTQQARDAFNAACQDAATMGVTVLAASGDNGAVDNDPSGQKTVDFPAACPFIVGCGGTKLTINNGQITDERVWNELPSGEGAGGGGVSQLIAIPDYQANAGVPAYPNGFAGRGVPDVAGDADPVTGYKVLVDGQNQVIGGTSAVAPLLAGLLARINQSLGTSVGFLNPLLYKTTVAKTFHDIVDGDNAGWNAGPGWDPCTGQGSPNGAALLTALGAKAAAAD
jgi:kumamolisin